MSPLTSPSPLPPRTPWTSRHPENTRQPRHPSHPGHPGHPGHGSMPTNNLFIKTVTSPLKPPLAHRCRSILDPTFGSLALKMSPSQHTAPPTSLTLLAPDHRHSVLTCSQDLDQSVFSQNGSDGAGRAVVGGFMAVPECLRNLTDAQEPHVRTEIFFALSPGWKHSFPLEGWRSRFLFGTRASDSCRPRGSFCAFCTQSLHAPWRFGLVLCLIGLDVTHAS